VDIDTESFDDPGGIEIIGGYNINPNFSVEVSYVDFGEASDNEPPEWLISSNTIALGAVGKVPLTPEFELFARLGYHSWDGELSESGYGKLDEDDGSGMLYGFGANYKLSEKFSIGVRYTNYNFDKDTDVTLLSANLQYNF
jgi:OOP family OmpA-OmpF porin